MAATGRRLSGLGTMFSSRITMNQINIRPSSSYILRGKDDRRGLGLNSNVGTSSLVSSWSGASHMDLQKCVPFLGVGHMMSFRGYASSARGKGAPADVNVVTPSDTGGVEVTNGGFGEVMESWHSYIGEKASSPYLTDVLVPVSLCSFAALMAWILVPRIFKIIHTLWKKDVAVKEPYENSYLGRLEGPAQCLLTFMPLSLIFPLWLAIFKKRYVIEVWKCAFVLSFVWFAKLLKGRDDRDSLSTLVKCHASGVFVIGLLGFAEKVYDGMLPSPISIGGIVGVVAAQRDIRGTISGSSAQDGSLERLLTKAGLTNTTLGPNSLSSSQVIANKCMMMTSKFALKVDEQDKIPQINDEIKNMLKSNTNLDESEQVKPYCHVSLVKWPFAELTLGCDLKYDKTESKDQFVGAQHDILLKVVKILENHGASLVEYHLAG